MRTKLEEVSMIQRTVFRRIFVLSVFLGLATTQDAVADFVMNGSFESPTFSGSGDISGHRRRLERKGNDLLREGEGRSRGRVASPGSRRGF
jgi:hypothetical protein